MFNRDATGSLSRLVLILVLLFGALALISGCGGSSGGGGGEETGDNGDGGDDGGDDGGGSGGVSAGGDGQKGPFQPGGTATAIELNDDGTPGSGSADGSIGDDGDYSIAGIDWTGPTSLRLEGTYFNENSGNFSGDNRSLDAVENVESSDVDTNVNLYTHFIAHRTRFLMSEGDAFADAFTQANTEFNGIADIDSDAGTLNLADVADAPEADSLNLLVFSAATLSAGLDQAGIDAIADDFADDGEINGSATNSGDGQSNWEAVVSAAADPDLLDTARTNIENQYGTTPPNGDPSGIAWMLSPCVAASLTEPRTVCEGEPFYGNHRDDSGEFVVFIPEVSGHYTIELFGDASVDDDNTGSCSWTVYTEDDTGSTDMGDSGAAGGFCGVEDVTNLRLSGGERYYIRPLVDQDDDTGPDARFRLAAVRHAEGKEMASQAVELPGEEEFSAVVGTLIGTSTTSYYRFTAGTGTHTITASGFPCSSTSAMRLTLYEEASNGFSTELANAWDDGCSQVLDTPALDPGREYYLKAENFLDPINRNAMRPSPGVIDYTLKVSND